MAELTPAQEAVEHVLRVIRDDGRAAYLLGLGSQSFTLLTRAHAETLGEDEETFRRRFWSLCHPERVVREEANT